MVGGSADLLAVTWFLAQLTSLPESINGSAWPTEDSPPEAGRRRG